VLLDRSDIVALHAKLLQRTYDVMRDVEMHIEIRCAENLVTVLT
jgi:hypothetical protein